MPPIPAKKSGGRLNVPATHSHQPQQQLTPVFNEGVSAVVDYSFGPYASVQSTAFTSCGVDTVSSALAEPNWYDITATPGFTLGHAQSIEGLSSSYLSSSPNIQRPSAHFEKRRTVAIDLHRKGETNTYGQNVAANASSNRCGLSRRGSAQFDSTFSTDQSPVQPSRSSSVATTSLSTESIQRSTAEPKSGVQLSRPGQAPSLTRVSSKHMAREYQSRSKTGEKMRPVRRDELEGTNILAPMFRDEYIKHDADGSSTGAASTTAEGNGNNGRTLERQSADASQPITGLLPVEKSFPIQIGSELFRLSGASIMSDGQYNSEALHTQTAFAENSRAPSYFSEFFVKQMNQSENGEIRTLYIDRDPATFQDICRHLQGYFVGPRDGVHYVRLFADAQFYNLPRLINQLFESPIYIEVGGQNFQVPRDLFGAPGNQSNFFSLGFGALFAEPVQVFPGLERHNLLRPPSIQPSIVTHRSAETFAEILFLLREYPLRIRDEEHRQALLNDAKYYHFRNLEQKLIHHKISFNIVRRKSEITLRLEDIKQSGISFQPDEVPLTNENPHEPPPPLGGYVNYARPYLEEPPAELILEIGNDSTEIDLRDMRADFYGRTSTIKDRISSLFQVIANKMNLKTTMPLGLMMANGGATALPKSPGFTPLSEHRVKVNIGTDAAIMLDGEEFVVPNAGPFQDTGGMDSAFPMQKAEYLQAIAHTPSPVSGPWPHLPPDHASALARAAAAAAAGHSQQQLPQSNAVPIQQQQQQQQQLQYQQQLASRKRKRRDNTEVDEGMGTWIVSKGQWRLRIQPRIEQTMGGNIEPRFEVVMCAVKLEAARGERGRNLTRGFLV